MQSVRLTDHCNVSMCSSGLCIILDINREADWLHRPEYQHSDNRYHEQGSSSDAFNHESSHEGDDEVEDSQNAVL